MRVRPAGPTDLALVTSLRLDFIADVRRLDRSSLAGRFAAQTATFVTSSFELGALHSWLAETDGGDALGVVSLVLHAVPPRPDEPRTTEGYVINMYVSPPHRGRGIGRALLEACRDAAAEMGLRRLTLHFTDEGLPLYQRTGFVADANWLHLPL